MRVLYPPTPRSDASDTFFGTRVPDPYRWLESTQSPEVKNWVSLEATLGAQQMAMLPDREAFRSTVQRLMSAPFDSVPDRGRDATIFARTVPNLPQPVLMVTRDGRTSVLLDPNARWPGSPTILAQWFLSPDGNTLAYATDAAGGGWLRWHTLSTTSGREEPGSVIGTPDWASISWARDSRGFYYDGYGVERQPPIGAPIGKGFAAFFHRAGTAQRDDVQVYARPDHPDWLTYASESWDGRYLILGAVEGSGSGGNLVAIRALRAGSAPTITLRELGAAQYAYVDNDGPVFYFQTTDDAPRGKVVAIDLRDAARERDVIPQRSDVLEDVGAAGGRFFARYLHDVVSHLVAFDRSGEERYEIALPGTGTASNVTGEPADPISYYSFSSPTYPYTVYQYDVRRNKGTIVSQRYAPFDPARYTTNELFAVSKDGTRIPVFVAHRRDLPLDGRAPAMITGYGGFGDAYHPIWQRHTTWMAGQSAFRSRRMSRRRR
ncbi:MAG TPA: hypothetical protein VGX91_04270 [Candidatus Cybelea sp.]|jgi:prolyl oligopeptidase|nr:hypothetical protein [Candidatus Cybelea sp.]